MCPMQAMAVHADPALLSTTHKDSRWQRLSILALCAYLWHSLGAEACVLHLKWCEGQALTQHNLTHLHTPTVDAAAAVDC